MPCYQPAVMRGNNNIENLNAANKLAEYHGGQDGYSGGDKVKLIKLN